MFVHMFQIWDTDRMKKVLFHPKALEEFRELPKPIKLAFGELLRILQDGITLGMPASRPMPGVAPGVDELRAKDASGQYRAFYVRKFSAGILVLRAFHKKTQETPMPEIKLARKRLQELSDEIT
jgi:phage-related protein